MHWRDFFRQKPERRQFPKTTSDLSGRARARLALTRSVCLPHLTKCFDFPLPLHGLSNRFRAGLQASGRVAFGSRLYTGPSTCFSTSAGLALNALSGISKSPLRRPISPPTAMADRPALAAEVAGMVQFMGARCMISALSWETSLTQQISASHSARLQASSVANCLEFRQHRTQGRVRRAC